MQFHILSFEGPDPYSRSGGLATRVIGLSSTLASLGCETHLWFIGDPDLPGHEQAGDLHLHRWCQWVSEYHPGGVYDGEEGKVADYNHSLPPFLAAQALMPHLQSSLRGVVLAEEWQTVHAVLHLHWLLERAGLRDRVTILWNANNTFGFDRIPWDQLRQACTITTVSRYMKHRMREWGVEALVIPNGLDASAFDPPDRPTVQLLRRRFRDRVLLTKMARWDPDKRWLGTLDIIQALKQQGARPLLVARGGNEAYGSEVWRGAQDRGLRVIDRKASVDGTKGLVEALQDVGDADIVNLTSFVDAPSRSALFRGTDAVLANSGHEPFGLVGLETMAVGGIAATGCSGEDYAVPGQNALVLETDDPREFISFFHSMKLEPTRMAQMRRAGRATARRYAWPHVVERVLMPRVEARSYEKIGDLDPPDEYIPQPSDEPIDPVDVDEG
ncbi:MAG: glycosyltransferase family 4 protein [Myxococcota bacterium]